MGRNISPDEYLYSSDESVWVDRPMPVKHNFTPDQQVSYDDL